MDIHRDVRGFYVGAIITALLSSCVTSPFYCLSLSLCLPPSWLYVCLHSVWDLVHFIFYIFFSFFCIVFHFCLQAFYSFVCHLFLLIFCPSLRPPNREHKSDITCVALQWNSGDFCVADHEIMNIADIPAPLLAEFRNSFLTGLGAH